MKKKARFYTVADPEVGLGHLFRCDALAYALSLHDVDVELLVESRAGKAWIESFPLYSPYRLEKWTDNRSSILEALTNCDIRVFDAYTISKENWEAVDNSGKDIVVFDDYGEKPFLKGVLVNGSVGAFDIGYGVSSQRKLLLGPDYQVLRPPFWQKSKREIKNSVESIGIMLGGTDHRNLLPEVVNTVLQVIPASVTVYVIGKPDTIEISGNIIVTGILGAQEIKELFDSLDILVSAAGQSVAEAVSCDLPVLMLATEENQKYNYRGWRRKKAAVQGGVFYEVEANNWVQLRSELLNLLEYTLRKELSLSSSRLQLTVSTEALCSELLHISGDTYAKNNSLPAS